MLRIVKKVSESDTYDINNNDDDTQTKDLAWEINETREAIENEDLKVEEVEVEEVRFRELLTRRSNNLVSLKTLRVSSLTSNWKSTLLTSAKAVRVK